MHTPTTVSDLFCSNQQQMAQQYHQPHRSNDPIMILPSVLRTSWQLCGNGNNSNTARHTQSREGTARGTRGRSLSNGRSRRNADSGYGANVRSSSNIKERTGPSVIDKTRHRSPSHTSSCVERRDRSLSFDRRAQSNNGGSMSVGRENISMRHRSPSQLSRGSATSRKGGMVRRQNSTGSKSNRSNDGGSESDSTRDRIPMRRNSQSDNYAELSKPIQAESQTTTRSVSRQDSMRERSLSNSRTFLRDVQFVETARMENETSSSEDRTARCSTSRQSSTRERNLSSSRTSLHDSFRGVKFNSPEAKAATQRTREAGQTSFSSTTSAACRGSFGASTSMQSASQDQVPNIPDRKAELRTAASKQDTTSPCNMSRPATASSSTKRVTPREIQNIVNSIHRPRHVALHQADFNLRKETKQSQANLDQSHRSADTTSTSDHNASVTGSSWTSSCKSVKSAPYCIKSPDRSPLLLQRRCSESNLAAVAPTLCRRVSFKETTDTIYISPRVAKPTALFSPWITGMEGSNSPLALLTSGDKEKKYEDDDLSANTALLQCSYSSEIARYINGTDSFCGDARSVVEGEFLMAADLSIVKASASTL